MKKYVGKDLEKAEVIHKSHFKCKLVFTRKFLKSTFLKFQGSASQLQHVDEPPGDLVKNRILTQQGWSGAESLSFHLAHVAGPVWGARLQGT